MELELDIYPIPFARRLASLKSGEIDIMVGLKHTHKQRKFSFLQPSYESLKAIYFIRKSDQARMQQASDLAHLIGGFSIDEKEFIEQVRSQFKDVVTVTNLEQKIKLLARGRIDTFVHFESSAEFKIREMGMRLIKADYQPADNLDYHIGISLLSPLLPLREKLENVIEQGVANGDLVNIRLQHEAAIETD
jgi:ABC-type amino acid transport substrate-binding protein